MPADASLDELPKLAAYATHVSERLCRPETLPVERPISLRPSAHAWFVARAEEAERKLEPMEKVHEPGEFPAPHTLQTAMMSCQKPFQLWNVKRDEWQDGLLFESGLKYEIGKAALEGGPSKEGRP